MFMQDNKSYISWLCSFEWQCRFLTLLLGHKTRNMQLPFSIPLLLLLLLQSLGPVAHSVHIAHIMSFISHQPADDNAQWASVHRRRRHVDSSHGCATGNCEMVCNSARGRRTRASALQCTHSHTCHVVCTCNTCTRSGGFMYHTSSSSSSCVARADAFNIIAHAKHAAAAACARKCECKARTMNTSVLGKRLGKERQHCASTSVSISN